MPVQLSMLFQIYLLYLKKNYVGFLKKKKKIPQKSIFICVFDNELSQWIKKNIIIFDTEFIIVINYSNIESSICQFGFVIYNHATIQRIS